MTGVNEVDLKSVTKRTTSNVITSLGIGAVPSGMRRWITFVKLTTLGAGANAIFLGSGTTATDISSGNWKDHQALGNQFDAFAYPDSPRISNPLFSIAGGKYLTCKTSSVTAAVFIQYYDR